MSYQEIFNERLGPSFSVYTYDTVTSTNTLAKEAALNGAPEGTVFIANAQTAGRGRMGRTFFSPTDSGLYMSCVLRPFADTSPTYLTTAAAVAVAMAIEEVAKIPASIKWVNDVYCRGKKVCGILTEGNYSADGHLQYAVLGIGINVFQPVDGDFPNELKERAGAVFVEKMPLSSNLKEELATTIVRHFWGYYQALSAKTFLDAYRDRDCLSGKIVNILDLSGKVTDTVTVAGITDDFGLRVRFENGNETVLSSGEVSLQLGQERR